MSYGPPPGYGYGGAPPASGYSYPPPAGYPGGYPPSYPGYGAPPAYGGYPPHSGYGPIPPGYGHRDRSRSRGRDRRGDRRDDDRRGDRGGARGGAQRRDAQPAVQKTTQEQQRVLKLLKSNPGWRAVWLEGIDPPKRQATASNVTAVLLTRANLKKDGNEEFGFVLSVSRLASKKQDRERDCAKDLVAALDRLPLEQPSAWCQFDIGSAAKQEVEQADVDRLASLVRKKLPNATVQTPEPTTFVLVSSAPWGPHEKQGGADADLAALELFDTGFAELLQEARRVNGLVRKQWFIALVLATLESSEPFTLGVGLAADSNLAKARAVHAAEIRSQVLTEAMFKKLPLVTA